MVPAWRVSIGSERYREAVDDFSRVLQLDPQRLSAKFSRAVAYQDWGNSRKG